MSQRCYTPVVCLRNVAGDGLGSRDNHVRAGQGCRASGQRQRGSDVVAVQDQRCRHAFGAVDVLLRPVIPVAQRAATDYVIRDRGRVLQPVSGLDLVHRGGGRNGDGGVLEVGVLQTLGDEQAAVADGGVRRRLDDHQVLDDIGRARRNRPSRRRKRDARVAADGADLIPSRDGVGVRAAEADARAHRQAGRPFRVATRHGGAADTHGARGVVLQDRADAPDSVNSGGRERDRDRADEGVGVGASHPRPKLHAPGGCSRCRVRPENPEQVVGDLHRMHELAGDGQRGFRKVRHASRRRPDELVSIAAANVVLTCVLASVDLGGVISSAYCNLS